MKGLSLWLKKVRAFLGLVTLLKRLGRQSAEEHNHYNPTSFRVFKNAEPRNVRRRRPTLSSIPVVTGNRVDEHFLPGDQSRPALSPGCREQETTTAQSLARNMHPMPFFHPAWPFPPYRPGPWLNPFPHWYGILDPSKDRLKERIKSLNDVIHETRPPPSPLSRFLFFVLFVLWWVTNLPLAFCNIRI